MEIARVRLHAGPRKHEEILREKVGKPYFWGAKFQNILRDPGRPVIRNRFPRARLAATSSLPARLRCGSILAPTGPSHSMKMTEKPLITVRRMRVNIGWNDRQRRLSMRLANGSKMLGPTKRYIVVRVAGETAIREVVFEGHLLTVNL